MSTKQLMIIDKINNKNHGLSPPGGLVSPSGGFALLALDQAVPKNSQRHLADGNAISILHRSDCAWLCCLLSQCYQVQKTPVPYSEKNELL